MPTILQLSDVHLDAYPDQARETIEPLVEAFALLRESGDPPPDLVAFTGDVFDSSTIDAGAAVAQFSSLIERAREALGARVPVVVLPGNHDRRRAGLLAPPSGELFDALRDARDDRTVVTGCGTPFLSDLIPREVHGLPASVVAIDSTFVPKGLVSAGGLLRQEDLLLVADLVADDPAEQPVVMLTHHHLVPTPLTDLSRVDVNTQSTVLRWLARNVLGRLVGYADREELTMTALGAGTALSTLHTLGRAVIVLHGHKHYPTARALRGTMHGHGDVLLVAAGSAGTVLAWSTADDSDVAHLWPSFNVIELGERRVAVDSVAFRPRKPGSSERTRLARRPLLRATQRGAHWDVEPVDDKPVNRGPTLALNAARYVLEANHARSALWDLECERVVRWGGGQALDEYVDVEDGAPGSVVEGLRIGDRELPSQKVPATLRLPVDGTPVRYRIAGGACRTLEEVQRAYGPIAAYDRVDLLNRYASERAELVLEGVPESVRAFGSAIDLTTGNERPVRVQREGGRATLAVLGCPPRTLLRILWAAAR